MKILAFLYDIARHMNGDVKFIEEILDRLSRYGYNMLSLNLEYRFDFPSHPGIAPVGSLNPDDIRRLDAKAKSLGIELVPFANCACHTGGILSLEKYKHLGVNDKGIVEQVKVGDEASYNFITELFRDLFDCFSSKYFHIGADEIRRLQAEFPDLTDEERWDKAMDFLVKICNFVKENGKIVMLWGDMWANHPERRKTLDRLPDDVIICNGHYYGDIEKGPGRAAEAHKFYKESGKKFIAAPSINSYYGMPILSKNSEFNIIDFTRIEFEVGGGGVFLTSWEYNDGGIFSAHWPFIYLQSKVFKGDYNTADFFREYTAAEWGMDNDLLKDWYQYIDKDIQTYLEPECRKHGHILTQYWTKLLRKQLLHNTNIFIAIRNITWLNEERIDYIIESVKKALPIAEKMHSLAVRRKEESEALLEWNKTYLAAAKICKLYLHLKEAYHEAAILQFKDNDGFIAAMDKCAGLMDDMIANTEVLYNWEEHQIKFDNHAPSESWHIKMALNDLKDRRMKLEKEKTSHEALMDFNDFTSYPVNFFGRRTK